MFAKQRKNPKYSELHTRQESVFPTEPSEHNRPYATLLKDDLSDCATLLKDDLSDCANLLKDDLTDCETLVIPISKNDVGLPPNDHPSHGINQCNKNHRLRLHAPGH